MGAATVYVFCASPYFTQVIKTPAGNIADGRRFGAGVANLGRGYFDYF